MLKKLFDKYSGLRYVLSSASAFVVDTALYYVFNHFLFGIALNMGTRRRRPPRCVRRVRYRPFSISM